MSEELKAQVRRCNDELFDEGNLDLVDEVFAADCVSHGTGKDWRGRKVIKEGLAELRTAFPDLQVTIDEMVAEGDKVAWHRTHRGTHQGEIMGIPATGKNMTWRTIVISRFADGKVVEEWAISDLLMQLQ